MEWSDLARRADQLPVAISFLKSRLDGLVLPDELAEVSGVALGTLRVMVEHAQVIQAASGGDFVEATGANVRTLLEGYGELHYLLTRESLNTEAIRNVVFGLYEFREFLADEPQRHAQLLHQVDERLSQYERSHPAVVERVRRDRKKRSRPGYWSLDRTKLLEFAGSRRGNSVGLVRLYEALTWDTHLTVLAALQVRVRNDAGTIRVEYGPTLPAGERSILNRSAAVNLLAEAWRLVVDKLPISRKDEPLFPSED